MDGRSWTGDLAGHALVAGGGMLVVAGVVTLLRGNQQIDDVNQADDHEDYLTRRDEADGAETLQKLGVAGIALGGALLAGGVVHYVWYARPAEPAVVGAVGLPGGAMAVVRGSF